MRCLLPIVLLAACRREAPPVAPTSVVASPVVPESAAQASEPVAPIPEDAFATVNGVVLPMSAFDAIYSLKVAKYRDRGRELPASGDRRYRKSISERLIMHELLRQAAEVVGVAPDPAETERRMEKSRIGIRDWATHLQRRGETDQSLRDMYDAEQRERLILERRGALAATDAEIDARYQQTKETRPKSEVEARIRGEIAERKLYAARRSLLEELRASAQIVDAIAVALGPEPEMRGPAVRVHARVAVGLEACDAVIADYVACVSLHPAEVPRDELLTAIADVSHTWRDGAATSETREATGNNCLAFREQVASSMVAIGCKWRAK